MRNVDHKDVRKHIAAISRIKPICTSELVKNVDDNVVTMRFLLDWKGSKIKAGLVIGGIVDGEPLLSEVGFLCLKQWINSHPEIEKIVFAEFKHVATGNVERLRSLLTSRLDDTKKLDNAIILIMAKNSVMYDKLGALIGIGAMRHPWSLDN